MAKLFFISVFLLLYNTGFSQKDDTGRPIYPPSDKFVVVQTQPKPTNLDAIRRQIRYPESLRQAGIESDLLFKILIDENGRYIKHIVRKGHPLLVKEYEQFLPLIKWTPAIQNGKKVSFWLNYPVKICLRY